MRVHLKGQHTILVTIKLLNIETAPIQHQQSTITYTLPSEYFHQRHIPLYVNTKRLYSPVTPACHQIISYPRHDHVLNVPMVVIVVVSAASVVVVKLTS